MALAISVIPTMPNASIPVPLNAVKAASVRSAVAAPIATPIITYTN